MIKLKALLTDPLSKIDMRQRKIVLAPIPDLVHFLAVFYRAFRVIHRASEEGNRDEMLLGGWVANALHNVPRRLCYYNPDGWFDDRPEVFPRFLRTYAPQPVVVMGEYIFSSAEDLAVLGLNADLSNLAVGPPRKLRQYMTVFYYASIAMRVMLNYGGRPPYWDGLDQKWNAEAEEQSLFNGKLAQALQDAAVGLLRWSDFNEKQFWRRAKLLGSEVPGKFRETWPHILKPKRLL